MKYKIYQLIVLIVFVVTAIYFVNKQSKLINDKKILENNIEVLNDSITITKSKAGELQFEKGVLISTNKNLKYLNKDLNNEVSKQNGKVVSLSSLNLQYKLKIDDLEKYINSNINEPIVKLNDSTYNLTSTLSYYYDKDSINYDIYKIRTLTTVNNTKILSFKTDLMERNSNMDISIGYKFLDDKISLFVKSDYPLNVDDIQSYIDINNKAFKKYQKKKKYSVGFSVGYGITKNFELSPFIGVGITRKLFEF